VFCSFSGPPELDSDVSGVFPQFFASFRRRRRCPKSCKKTRPNRQNRAREGPNNCNTLREHRLFVKTLDFHKPRYYVRCRHSTKTNLQSTRPHTRVQACLAVCYTSPVQLYVHSLCIRHTTKNHGTSTHKPLRGCSRYHG
jgi:hypothetical protein